MNISFIGDDAPCQENFVARQDISMTELAEALPSARSKSMKARESDFMNEGMAPSNPPSPTVPRTPARSKVFFSTISPRRAATGFIKQTRNGRCEALLGESPPCVIPNESALLPAAVAPAPILANKSFSCGTPSKPSPSIPLAVHSDVSEAQEVPPAQGHAIVENDDPNVHSKPRRQRTPKRLSDVNPYSDLTPLQRDIILVILTLTEETLQTDRPRSIYPPINGEQPWKGVPAKPLVRTIQAKYPNLSEDEMVYGVCSFFSFLGYTLTSNGVATLLHFCLPQNISPIRPTRHITSLILPHLTNKVHTIRKVVSIHNALTPRDRFATPLRKHNSHLPTRTHCIVLERRDRIYIYY